MTFDFSKQVLSLIVHLEIVDNVGDDESSSDGVGSEFQGLYMIFFFFFFVMSSLDLTCY